MIREGQPTDFPEVLELLLRLHQASPYRDIPPERDEIRRTYGQCIASALMTPLVAVREGKIVGVLFGMIDRLWWSRKRYATDLVFYSEHPGAGLMLAREFISWAEEHNAAEITMGQSSAMQPGKSEIFYRRLGLDPVGGLYTRVLIRSQEKEQCLAS